MLYWSLAVTVAVTLPPAVTVFEESVNVDKLALGVVDGFTVSDCVAVTTVASIVAVIVRDAVTCGLIAQVATPEAFVFDPQVVGNVPVSAPPV